MASKTCARGCTSCCCARYSVLPLLLATSVAVVVACLSNNFAYAVPLNHGDFMGNTVWYRQVTEDANSPGDSPPLYGAPTVAADTLDFDPVGFGASSSGGGAPDVTDGNLSFMIEAKANQIIEKVQFNEAGDTLLTGFGTDATFTSVTAFFFVDILHVDGVGITPIQLTAPMVITPQALFGLGTDGGGGPLFGSFWNGMVMFDLTQALIDEGVAFTNGVTKASVNLNNILIAASEENTTSQIAKKDFKGLSITANPIPEPTTLGLVMLGAFSLLARSSRRDASRRCGQ